MPLFWLPYPAAYVYLSQTPAKKRQGALSCLHEQKNKTMIFRPKLTFLGNFWATNGHFSGWCVCRIPIICLSYLATHVFLSLVTAKQDGGALNLLPEPKKDCFWPEMWPFFGWSSPETPLIVLPYPAAHLFVSLKPAEQNGAACNRPGKPEIQGFDPKLSFLRERGGLKHPFSYFHTLQHVFS